MRSLALAALFALAACSEAGREEAPKGEAEAEAPAAARIDAGQWEVTTEVVRLVGKDKGAPAFKTPPGTKSSISKCVSEADAAKPPAELFAGAADKCEYRDFYMRNGRVNAAFSCRRPGLEGEIMTRVNGSFTATTLEGTTDIDTYLVTDGDVEVAAKIAGRRVGACAAG